MDIRPAKLNDTQAITALYCGQVDKWQRVNTYGRSEDSAYADLTVYERWLHGGAWMSVETAAIWLSYLERHGAIQLVVEADGEIVGYGLAHQESEAVPLGQHLYIGDLKVRNQKIGAKAKQVLLEEFFSIARKIHYATVTFPDYDTEQIAYYLRQEFQPFFQVKGYLVSARSGSSFYRAVEHTDANPLQIEKHAMLIGRVTSSLHQWQSIWSNLWTSIPEIARRRIDRLQFHVANQDAFVCIRQQLHDPRAADVYCWSIKPLSIPLIIAIRDWAYRKDYRTLQMIVAGEHRNLLGTDVEDVPYKYTVLRRSL